MKIRILLFTVALIAGLAIGWLSGLSHSRQQLAECHKQNRRLANDLNIAVSRGVILETNLTLCKEEKK